MDSHFERYSIIFGIKEDKVDIFKTIIRFLDHLTRNYNMGFRIDYAKRMNKKISIFKLGRLSMKWKHEFYQDNPDTNDKYDFYHSQRRVCAILEVVREIKSNYYEAKVVSIESDENFQVMGQAGGCKHQYKIGDTFTLRHHKNKKGYEWFCDHSDKFWYDPRFKDKDFGERFELIE